MGRRKKSDIRIIFDYWNEQKIIIHRDMKKLKSNINAALKNYSLDEIKGAISNYKIILESDDYFWTHRWPLKHFLQRGLERFLTINDPFSNFRRGGIKNEKAKRLGQYTEFEPRTRE